jgi:hypothetical protein
MKWQAMSRDEALRVLAVNIRCKVSGEGLRIAVISECLRAASYLCSAPIEEYGACKSAASLSLTSMVRRRLSSIWPELAEECDTPHGVMTVLNSLGDVGDLTKVKDSRWLTSPARGVRAADTTAVVIGGGPSQTFPRSVQLISGGRVRIADARSCEGWIDICDPHEWIGAPMGGLEAWSNRLLTAAKGRLVNAPAELNEISIYSTGRWAQLVTMPHAQGIFLSRCQTGPKHAYFIGSVSHGRLRRMAYLNSQEARRLSFQLDIQAGCPMKVEAKTSHGFAKLQLWRRLPREEEKTLLLGWQIPSPQGAHPGVTSHVLPIEMLPIIRSALDGLGVVLHQR